MRTRSPIAGGVLCAACLAGALGALSGGTSLARSVLSASNATRARRHGQSGLPGLGQHVGSSQGLQPLPKGGRRGGQRSGRRRSRLAGPPELAAHRHRRPRHRGARPYDAGPSRVAPMPACPERCAVVTATWVLVATLALGNAGPLALAMVGLGSLAGAFAIGWKGLARTGDWTTKWRVCRGAPRPRRWSPPPRLPRSNCCRPGTGLSGSAMWRGLAVVVMGAGIVLLAVLPATSRLRVEHLGNAASILSEKALPALAKALDALAIGEPGRVPMSELSELKAATRPLEAELGAFAPTDGMLVLTKALVEASNQVLRLAAGVEAVARLDGRRLEELVEEHTAVRATPTATWSTRNGGGASCSTAQYASPRENAHG